MVFGKVAKLCDVSGKILAGAIPFGKRRRVWLLTSISYLRGQVRVDALLHSGGQRRAKGQCRHWSSGCVAAVAQKGRHGGYFFAL
jgi:hypothetical protein